MFALNIDKTTNRIMSATYIEYAAPDAVFVKALPPAVAAKMPSPEGDIYNYLIIDGAYIYAPVPAAAPPVPVAPRNVITGECVTINGTLYKAIKNIPAGEPVIIGQNAVETTYEAELLALSQQKG